MGEEPRGCSCVFVNELESANKDMELVFDWHPRAHDGLNCVAKLRMNMHAVCMLTFEHNACEENVHLLLDACTHILARRHT